MSDIERLPTKTVRWLNKELEPQGLRVCTDCQGHPQPLDAAHFYPRKKGRFEYRCLACRRAQVAAYNRSRYQADANYRAQKCATRVMEGEALERKRRSAREWKRRRRAAKFAAVLATHAAGGER